LSVAQAGYSAELTELTVGTLPNKASSNGVYIVRLTENPVVAYEGGIKGLKATKPGKGKKIDPNNPTVVRYSDYLISRHDAVLANAGGGSKLYSYRYAYNGFAAKLSPGQARKLATTPGVQSVVADELLRMDTVSTPKFLGLEAAGDGLWDLLGGAESAGEDVIVGIIDSGIWPENPSFSDRTGVSPTGKTGKLGYQQIPGWHGKCTPGEEFPASKCSQKLIGAQWFNSGFGGDAQTKASFPYEYISPRDADGHGSHTASTAAGNSGVQINVRGNDLGTASGMAPRARLAAYKVCWGRGTDGGCFGSDSVAAIDQAVADGVDVLNFSISGSSTNFLDQVEVAFLYAADAGVFVAASAGNAGPGASTVAHNSPWLTTVAAGTHDRFYAATVTLGDGSEYIGASVGSGAGPADLVYGGDFPAAGAAAADAARCFPNTLNDAAVTGKIVLCDRGVIDRVAKSAEVARAGGIGMVHANVSPSTINADLHSVPTVHVDHIDGAVIRSYAQTAGATATLSAGTLGTTEASFVAGFSSRGPALAGNGDLLKPDIMAPGVDVLAAYSPSNGGDDYAFLSGTSMSSPHMAGLGALMKQRFPGMSPAAIKSALMTSATTLTNAGNSIPGGPFDYGAGFVQPNAASDPGLVYDAGFLDWLGFLCGTTDGVAAGTCAFLESIGVPTEPSDLNYPSIAIGALAGSQTVTRRVTNVSGGASTYTASVEGLTGVDVNIEPTSFVIGPGGTADYTVTFSNDGAPVNTYATGAIVWSDGAHSVRSPVAVRPIALDAPDEISAAGADGSVSFDVTFGYEGDYTAAAHGLEPATMTDGNVVDDPANDINTALSTGVGVTFEYVDVPAGTALTRFSLFDEYTDGNDDLDLYVFYQTGAFVGSSGGGSSAEEVSVLFPAPGTYIVAVHGWQTDGADSNYTLFSWSVSATPGGNLSVDSAPASAVLGATEAVNISWSGAAAGTKHLGAVSHSDSGGLIDLTVVSVDTD
jgi:subtilisin family serine protease